jgi:hypothetical protein
MDSLKGNNFRYLRLTLTGEPHIHITLLTLAVARTMVAANR